MANHHDKLYRFLFDELDIRGELVYLNQSWQQVRSHSPYPEPVARQLGEAMAAVAILSATIKFDGSLIMQIQSSGPLRTLVAQAGNSGNLRGLAKWRGEVPEQDLTAVFGKGQMAITISNKGGERYQSIVALSGARLGDALEGYFSGSEQLASRFWLFAAEDQVAGLFIQQLPGSQGSASAWERISVLAGTTSAEEIHSLPPEELLHRLFHEEKVRLFSPTDLHFACTCSREKIENTLFAMGREEVQEIIQNEGSIEVDCEFCNRHYSFGQDEVDRLFSYQGPSDEAHILH